MLRGEIYTIKRKYMNMRNNLSESQNSGDKAFFSEREIIGFSSQNPCLFSYKLEG